MAKLNSLLLDGNQVSDLTPLKSLRWLSTLRLRQNKVSDLAPLSDLRELRYTFLEGTTVSDLGPLVEMARKDVAGEQRFAPYWRIFIDADKLPEPAKAQLEELQKLGVRVNPKS